MGLGFGLQVIAWSSPVLPVVSFACIALCMLALQAQKVCHLQDIVWWQPGTNTTVYQRGGVSVAAHNGILRCRAAQCVICMGKHRGCVCVSVVRVPRHGLADGVAGVQVGLVSGNSWAVCWGSHCGWTYRGAYKISVFPRHIVVLTRVGVGAGPPVAGVGYGLLLSSTRCVGHRPLLVSDVYNQTGP